MSSQKTTIKTDSEYVLAGQVFNTPELGRIRDFFQYLTPNKSLSPLSLRIDEHLSDDEKDALWIKLLNEANANEQSFIFELFLNHRLKDIDRLKLSDQSINADCIKGFIQIKNSNKSGLTEHKVDALLKRIRNALAHGRVHLNGEFLILEDKKNELTARIVVTTEVLGRWKNIIEEEVAW